MPEVGCLAAVRELFCFILAYFQADKWLLSSIKLRKQLTFFTITFDVLRWPVQTHTASNAHFGHGGDDALGLLGQRLAWVALLHAAGLG